MLRAMRRRYLRKSKESWLFTAFTFYQMGDYGSMYRALARANDFDKQWKAV